MTQFAHAIELIRRFKGDAYWSGYQVLPRSGELARGLGRRAVLIRGGFPGSDEFVGQITESLGRAGLEVVGTIRGARPNAPREDLSRITNELQPLDADCYISFGGGSTLDAAKAAGVLRILGGTIDEYFGTGKVTAALETQGKKLVPHLAIQSAASSASHLTRYSNITDLATGQKKLIVDDAIIPPRAMFDYEVTLGAPPELTIDGALDGVSHSLEVLYGSVGKPIYGRIQDIAKATFDLVFRYLPRVLDDPRDREGREALALATDLGGYAIMLGGTNGAHLTSFSLVDILSHGRACLLMNPYYTVFYAPAIAEPLEIVGRSLQEAGIPVSAGFAAGGRRAGLAVANGLREFAARLGLPQRLADVPGFRDDHLRRALAAAKDPQLKMKLQNMPVPLTAGQVDDYLGPLLEAAKTGDLERIRNLTPEGGSPTPAR